MSGGNRAFGPAAKGSDIEKTLILLHAFRYTGTVHARLAKIIVDRFARRTRSIQRREVALAGNDVWVAALSLDDAQVEGDHVRPP